MVRVTKRWALPGAVAAGVLLLAGCSSTEVPSAAAVVGAEEIPLAELDDQLREISAVLGLSAGEIPPDFTRAVLTINVRRQLIDQTAESLGLSVTESEVQETVAGLFEFDGGADRFEVSQAQSGVAPSMVEATVRSGLLASAIGEELDPGSSQDAQDDLMWQAIRAYSDEAGTTVNPRFGYWDNNQVVVIEDPGAPVQAAERTDLPLLP